MLSPFPEVYHRCVWIALKINICELDEFLRSQISDGFAVCSGSKMSNPVYIAIADDHDCGNGLKETA
jgi:hypothetical protein